MVEIKKAISFDEYMTIVNNVSNSCFPDDTYSPAYYELMFRYCLIKIFAPNYNVPEFSAKSYNDVWERITNKEANKILKKIRRTSVYPDLENAVKEAVGYKIKMLTSSPMSMADMALAGLINTFAEQVENMPIVSKETAEKAMKNMANFNSNTFAKDMFNAMAENGAFKKEDEE